MRFALPISLAALLIAGPALADGRLAITGLEEVAAASCGHTAATLDPDGLAAALDAAGGEAMGLRNADTIIGIIYESDPPGGARMWASTTAGRGGCTTLIRILSQPAEATLAEVQ
ncbi:hypothetical protein [Gymnodinialimonas ulvae]|uniref:hypothetical protein n=1 Tax=Gymnodinialimonas ulvae TaxID=3126504 RepID=UPI003097C463